MAKSGAGPCAVTVSVSVGVAFVNMPSVPEIVKVYVIFGTGLPNVTVNGVPAADGVTGCGANTHVGGVPAGKHVKATVPLYPLVAVAIPFQVTVEFTGVEVESPLGGTAIVKFPEVPLLLPATPPHEICAMNPSPRQSTAIPP